MAHKFDPARCARLESPERLALLPIQTVLRLVAPRAGEWVADVGCGPGVFTVPLARAVGAAGRVFALDIEPGMVEACERRVRSLGLGNVVVDRSGESTLPLRAASIDFLFASHLLHELLDPATFFAEVRRVLRRPGRFVAVEWAKLETGQGPPLVYRLAPHDARALLEQNGFRVERAAPVTWANYLVIARPRA
jgi:ubiquinone/menaquinone biosynthesis C-methylase UbiE